MERGGGTPNSDAATIASVLPNTTSIFIRIDEQSFQYWKAAMDLAPLGRMIRSLPFM